MPKRTGEWECFAILLGRQTDTLASRSSMRIVPLTRNPFSVAVFSHYLKVEVENAMISGASETTSIKRNNAGIHTVDLDSTTCMRPKLPTASGRSNNTEQGGVRLIWDTKLSCCE